MSHYAARAVLAASGALACFVTLLPAAIAGLIALFDVSAHGLLGMSGTLLNLASPFPGGSGGLAAYHGVAVDLPSAAVASILRGLAPVGMTACALVGSQWRTAIALAAFACFTAGWPALPGLLAAGCLCFAPKAQRT